MNRTWPRVDVSVSVVRADELPYIRTKFLSNFIFYNNSYRTVGNHKFKGKMFRDSIERDLK